MPADEQVCVIYAGVKGYLDDVVTSDISKFESLFLTYMKANHADIMKDILDTGVLSDENNTRLGEILTEWIPNSGLELRVK